MAKSDSTNNSIKQLLKILCIHGYRQTGATFRGKMGAFRKSIKNLAELVYMDAPHSIPLTQDEVKESEAPAPDQLGWWFSQKNCTFSALQETDVCIGYEESIEAVEKVFQQQGPFDGLLGFSQGAALVALLCYLKKTKEFKGEFSFAVICSGFKSLSSAHQEIYNLPIEIPSLHIYGESDEVIPAEMSKELTSCFVNPKCCVHTGGHFIPTSGTTKNEYKSFLQEMIALKET